MGAIVLALGVVGVLTGLAGAAFGGFVMNDAASDAGRDCGSALFPRPCDPNAGERAEAGFYIATSGGAIALLGLFLLVTGLVLVFIGVAVARRERLDAIAAARGQVPDP